MAYVLANNGSTVHAPNGAWEGQTYTGSLVGTIDDDGTFHIVDTIDDDGIGRSPALAEELEQAVLEDLQRQFEDRADSNWPEAADWPEHVRSFLGQ